MASPLPSLLLHSQVKEPHVMLEVGDNWLRNTTNQHLPSYGLLVQLHLFHVLLPLGHFAEAEELVRGCQALTKEQRTETYGNIRERKHQWLQQEKEHLIIKEQPAMAWKKRLGSFLLNRCLSCSGNRDCLTIPIFLSNL